MSALVGVAACLCALSVFIVTGLNRADACKIAQVCKREALLVVAAARSVTDVLVARLKGMLGTGGTAQVSLGEVSEMIDVVRLGLSAGLSFDAALEVFCANRRSTLALRLERACMAWRVGVGTREDELLAAARDLDVRAPVKLLIPTGTLILPALLLSILGPLLGAGGMM